MNRVRDAFGTAFQRLDRFQQLPVASPWLFAALTTVPVLVAYLVVTVIAVPLPDLVAVSLAMQPRLGVGTDRVVLTLSVRNSGGSAVPESVARYYLQPHPSIGEDGPFLGQQPLGALSPGQVATVSTTVVVPRSVVAGSYTVLACVAPTIPTAERNVRNNCQRSAPFEIASNEAR